MRFFTSGLLLLLLFIMSISVSFADAGDDWHAHYEGSAISDSRQAEMLLYNRLNDVFKILHKAELTGADLEKIHEISYSLEDGIDYLIANKIFSPALTTPVDEAVQAVHSSAENHDEVKTRFWTKRLEAALISMKAQRAEIDEFQPQDSYTLTLKDHRFHPSELIVSAGKKFKLIVVNQDLEDEEFQSDDFRREKAVKAGQEITIHVSPLKAGRYFFFGDKHKDTAQGYIIAE